MRARVGSSCHEDPTCRGCASVGQLRIASKMLCKLEPGAPRDPPFAPAPSLPLGLIAGFGNGPLPLRRGSCHAHSARQRRRDVEDLLTVESISPEVDGRLDAVHCLHHLVQAVAFALASLPVRNRAARSLTCSVFGTPSAIVVTSTPSRRIGGTRMRFWSALRLLPWYWRGSAFFRSSRLQAADRPSRFLTGRDDGSLAGRPGRRNIAGQLPAACHPAGLGTHRHRADILCSCALGRAGCCVVHVDAAARLPSLNMPTRR